MTSELRDGDVKLKSKTTIAPHDLFALTLSIIIANGANGGDDHEKMTSGTVLDVAKDNDDSEDEKDEDVGAGANGRKLK